MTPHFVRRGGGACYPTGHLIPLSPTCRLLGEIHRGGGRGHRRETILAGHRQDTAQAEHGTYTRGSAGHSGARHGTDSPGAGHKRVEARDLAVHSNGQSPGRTSDEPG